MFRDHDECLWHYLMSRERERTPYSTLVGQFLIGIGVGAVAVILGLVAFRPFSNSNFAIVAELALAALAVRWFTRGVIVLDYPLSDFRWLMKGLLGASFCCLLFIPWSAILLAQDYSSLKLILDWLRNHSGWVSGKTAGVILIVLLGSGVYGSSSLVVEGLFSWRSRYVTFFLLSVPALVLGPLVRRIQQGDQKPAEIVAQNQAFWAPVIGDMSTNWILGIGFVLFLVCEVLNAGIRKAQRSDELFKKTFIIAYPICFGTPMLALYLTRELMITLKIEGLIPLIGISAILSVGICIFATVLSVRRWSK
ncbi:MAG: hypothetical protein U1F83_04815 [Verrucomicrobiota bacterium]